MKPNYFEDYLDLDTEEGKMAMAMFHNSVLSALGEETRVEAQYYADIDSTQVKSDDLINFEDADELAPF